MDSRLVVADQKAAMVYVVDPVPGTVLREDEGTVLAEHAGFLPLPGYRLAYVDDAVGEVVVMDVFESTNDGAGSRVSVAIPGEHLAASPDGRFVAVSTGLGLSWEPWSDLVTVIDFTGEKPLSRRIRCRIGEPGVVLAYDVADRDAMPYVVLRHREPGRIEAFPVRSILDASAHCPVLRGDTGREMTGDGHGDAYDPVTCTIYTATSTGVERHHIKEGELRKSETLPWAVDGRAYYLRFCPRDRTLFAVVRGGNPDPKQWHRWTNYLWRYSIETGSISTAVIGEGLVFRLALTRGHVVVARIHPDRDEVISFRRLPGQELDPQIRSELPPMSGAPVSGREPWDDAQRRATAASPAMDSFAVSRGGHGQIHLLNAADPDIPMETLTMPTSLKDGGHMAWIAKEDTPEIALDTVGR